MNRRSLGDLPYDSHPPNPGMPVRPPSRAPVINLEPRTAVKLNAHIVPFNTSVTTTSKSVLASNEKRIYLMVQNNGTAVVRISIGSKAGATSFQIAAGGAYEFLVAPVGSVDLRADSGTQAVAIFEGTERGS